jgi:hypothetical protein
LPGQEEILNTDSLEDEGVDNLYQGKGSGETYTPAQIGAGVGPARTLHQYWAKNYGSSINSVLGYSIGKDPKQAFEKVRLQLGIEKP